MSEQFLVVDKDGALVTNTGAYTFTDPTTGVQFSAGETKQIKVTPWLLSQPVFKVEKVEKVEKAPDRPTKGNK
jgi:hypothetical protein